MRRFVLGVVVIVAASSASFAQSTEDAAIRKQLSGYIDARHTGNGKAQAAFYAEDADEWRDTNRRTMHGRAEISADLDRAGPANGFRLEIEQITDLAPNLALVDTQFFGVAPLPTGHASYLMVKRDGVWVIKSARISRYPEIPPSGASAATTDVKAANDALHGRARRE